jgi:hypothetical protein
MLKAKFYYPFYNSNGWSFWIGLFGIGIAGGLDTDGEIYLELFLGRLSIDYYSCTGQFSIEAAIGYLAWISFCFDGEQFRFEAEV